MERLGEIKPYQVREPVEIKVEDTTVGTHQLAPREGVEWLNDRTRVIRGKNFMDAWYKF